MNLRCSVLLKFLMVREKVANTQRNHSNEWTSTSKVKINYELPAFFRSNGKQLYEKFTWTWRCGRQEMDGAMTDRRICSTRKKKESLLIIQAKRLGKKLFSEFLFWNAWLSFALSVTRERWKISTCPLLHTHPHRSKESWRCRAHSIPIRIIKYAM